ncbi:hypothetical protein [Alkalilimnicola ehrlichii]|uniref:hypothetical protein n=1 Tax=Alkalilimnicola ehrlichii TaxID=351052 RepID=UPI0021614A61|nr:hypothetical protein [Alkalilimnicola ehrlichii]
MVSNTSTAPNELTPAFEFKGRMLTLTVLRVLTADMNRLAEQLDTKLAQAPDFFAAFRL